jgi:lysylphosphatidylglycerol synthetase-like protein (DUF2156 family)
VLAAALLSAAGYIVAVGYDLLALRFIGRALPLRQVAFASFASNALSNNVGNTLLTGGPLRYWFYRPLGVSPLEVAKIVLFCSVSFWVGYLFLAGVLLLGHGGALPSLPELRLLDPRFVGASLLALVVAYALAVALQPWLAPRRWAAWLPTPRLALGQLVVASLDILAMAAALYVLLPSATGLSFVSFVVLFLVAVATSAATQVPGGVGVFEALVLLLMGPATPIAGAAAALIAFRVVYCVLPLVVAAPMVALYRVGLGTRRARWNPASDAEIERARPIVERSPFTYPNLVYRREMALVFSDAGNAFVMFGQMHRSSVAMGDAVGPADEAEEATRRFHELCRGARHRPVFFEARGEQAGLYRSLGLVLTKLGEQARVELAQFDLAASRHAALRQACARVRRRGCRFEIAPAADVPALVPELLRVSQAWLAAKSTHEKSFSNASFDAEYLSHFPVAVVRDDHRVLAFANLWQSGGREELSVDLMRHIPDAPNGTMDLLFSEVMLWGRERDFRWFDFGVAPLAGLESGQDPALWRRVGTLLYRHGEHFYNFRGLRSYKDKFGPVWTPRYLASPGGPALPIALLDVTALIAGGLRAIVSKRAR